MAGVFVLDPGFMKDAEYFRQEPAAMVAFRVALEQWAKLPERQRVTAGAPVLYSTGVDRRGDVRIDAADVCRLERGRDPETFVWVPTDAFGLSIKIRRALGLQ